MLIPRRHGAQHLPPLQRKGARFRSDDMAPITKEKADSGIAWAQEEMGVYYFNGLHGVPTDVEKALSLFREAAEKGSARAMAQLGNYYVVIKALDDL